MTPLTRAVIEAYGAIASRDLPDAMFLASRDTLDALALENNVKPEKLPLSGNRLFGVPVFIDDSLPFGTVKCVAETEMDRVIRRAANAGHFVNVVKPPAFEMAMTPDPPAPTLKALLRHWLKRLRG